MSTEYCIFRKEGSPCHLTFQETLLLRDSVHFCQVGFHDVLNQGKRHFSSYFPHANQSHQSSLIMASKSQDEKPSGRYLSELDQFL